jgi:NitT/TauT family transport system substrate-binding protein
LRASEIPVHHPDLEKNQNQLKKSRKGHAMKSKKFAAGIFIAFVITVSLVVLPAADCAAAETTTVKIGYLHTLAVDGQFWLGEHYGFWEQYGIKFEPIRFYTGIDLFQALSGGSIDMLITGAVISNWPARGQGKVFLINNIEFGTAQLWVQPDSGINSLKDLKGKKISTTRGTTAHVFLHNALKSVGLAETDAEGKYKNVTVVNQRMSEAVSSFVSGAVPAVAMWVPFNVIIEKNVPGAKKISEASEFFPDAAIVGGWATTDEYWEKHRNGLLKQIVKAWIVANEVLVYNPRQSVEILSEKYYPEVPTSDLWENFLAERVLPAATWVDYYEDGTIDKWLDQVTNTYVEVGAFKNPRPAAKYFDSELLPKVHGEVVLPLE